MSTREDEVVTSGTVRREEPPSAAVHEHRSEPTSSRVSSPDVSEKRNTAHAAVTRLKRRKAPGHQGARNGGKSTSCPGATMLYPVEPHVTTIHGDTRTDEYFWLRNRKDPRVKHMVERENNAVQRYLSEPRSFPSGLPSTRRALFREMRERWKEDDMSLPTLDRHFWYYTRTVKNAEYPLFCRRPFSEREPKCNVDFVAELCALWQDSPDGALPPFDDEVVFLDVNLLVQQLRLDSVEIGEMDISPDETSVALTLDCSNGEEIYTLFILPIRDINFHKWMANDSDPMHRAWAKELQRSSRSVYTPLTPSSVQSSPVNSTATPTGRIGSDLLKSFPSSPQSSGGHAKSGREPTPHSPAVPPPRHTILHTIDIFDLSSEVLWVSESAVMYIAVDDKMRPFQLVYHDLCEADQSAASYVCFEEVDEAFWVGGLTFTADDHYVTFSSCSTEVSEHYVCPVAPSAVLRFTQPARVPAALGDGALSQGEVLSPLPGDSEGCRHRCLSSLPIAQPSLCDDSAAVDAESGEEISSVKNAVAPMGTAPVLRFSRRQECPFEYDLDHHEALLAPSRRAPLPGTDSSAASSSDAGIAPESGAWILTANAHDCTNFAVFIMPDDRMQSALCARRAGSDLSELSSAPVRTLFDLDAPSTSLWIPLFAYNPNYKIEGVESFYHFLLLSVRRDGQPATLFCPTHRIWAWWSRVLLHEDGGCQAMELCALFDLSRLVPVFPVLRAQHSTTCTVKLGSSPAQDACFFFSNGEGTTCSSSGGGDSDSPALPAELEGLSGVRLTPLQYAVECGAGSTSFFSCRLRLCAAHLLHPGLQLLCEYAAHTQTPAADSNTADEKCVTDTFTLTRLREEFVRGATPYQPQQYAGCVVWAPSDYFQAGGSPAASSLPNTGPLLVPTKNPSPVVSVPVTLCWRRDLYALGRSPLVLHVYGGYGDSDDPEFSTQRLSLLDRGLVWGYAAVRGGGEMGIPWRDEGRKLQRATTVNDYLSVVSYLQDKQLCEQGRLISCGSSAGGIPVFRAMCTAPQLFHAVVGGAPFVDCLTTLLDDSLPLTITEREEFGDPLADADAYHSIKSLSPVDAVDELARRVEAAHARGGSPFSLPHIFAQTSWEDTRVGYWEPLKLIANLRAKVYAQWQQWTEQCGGGVPPPAVLVCCDSAAGHGGASGRYEQLHETAREYAFILATLAPADHASTAQAS